DPQLSVAGPVVCGEAVDLAVGQLCGDGTHPPVDIIAPLSGREHLELGGQVFLPLLSEDRCVDWPAGALPMTGGARRYVPVRIASGASASVDERGLRIGWPA